MIDEIDYYLEFYKKTVPEFTKEELNFIRARVNLTILEKNEYYLKQSEIQKKLGFVSNGLLRQYYIDSKGNEITINFTPENTFTTDYSAFVKQKPSNIYIKAIERSTVIELNFEYIQEGYFLYKNYERFGRLITEKILIEKQKRLESFLFDSAEKRYLNFLKNYPNLYNRISLTNLSTFLGIERQSLSRIRKRISK